MNRRSYQSEEGWLLTYADLMTNLLMFFAMMMAASQISRSKLQQISESLSGSASPESLVAIEAEIEKQIQEKGLAELVTAEIRDEGLEMSLNSGLVFNSGQATILTTMQGTLDDMLKTLQPYSAKYHFAVEGHADSRQFAGQGQFRSNWELSTARANAVRERLESVGIDRARVRVEGYADTVPLPAAELQGLNEEEKLARHRRVVVRIY